MEICPAYCPLVLLAVGLLVLASDLYQICHGAGTFKLTLQFTEDYPNKAPTVRFVSKMFHPNSESNSLPMLAAESRKAAHLYEHAALH